MKAQDIRKILDLVEEVFPRPMPPPSVPFRGNHSLTPSEADSSTALDLTVWFVRPIEGSESDLELSRVTIGFEAHEEINYETLEAVHGELIKRDNLLLEYNDSDIVR